VGADDGPGTPRLGFEAVPSERTIAPGPVQPTWASLKAAYRCPEWFRDAKFGIWAHWSAQCVPEQGDWYARALYVQGQRQYDHHLKAYGHPSKAGFMEIDNLWKAEHWDPERLMELYVAAGARYFIALANHEDNFDCYASRYQEWNSVNVGPRRDIVGTWAAVARAHGLRFGVSNHSSHAWHWFQTAYGYDAEGPLAGVRYDAYRLTKADGKGTWWDGLDPQELYCGPSMVIPDGITSIKEARAWHDAHDLPWTEDPPPHNPAFGNKWYYRLKDLIDSYHPDLVYLDNTGLPLGQVGLDIAAHYYNADAAWNGGRLDGVLTAKGLKGEQVGAVTQDRERGMPDAIQAIPFEADTCIGEWHYKRDIVYKTVGHVARILVDAVSKNGTLLLNIPMRGDGTIDDREVAFLQGMARWIAVNGEGIYGSRPWAVFGEGPTKMPPGRGADAPLPYTPSDLRFTTKAGGPDRC
jgi:alpha-L-fucosidase